MRLLVLAAVGSVALRIDAGAGPVERIAYTYCGDYQNSECAVVVMDADGSNPLAVAPGAYPAPSPDGSRIALVRPVTGGCFDQYVWEDTPCYALFVVNVADMSLTQLTFPDFSADSAPAWSPDGSKIAFTSDRDGLGGLYVMSPDGSSVTRVTPFADTFAALAWSPDGGTLAYTCGGNVCRVGVDGTGFTQLTSAAADGYGFDPAWSPDGSTIAFETRRYRNPLGQQLDVAVMSADGADVTRVTSGFDAWSPAWSPDGTRLAFTTSTACGPEGVRRIGVVDRDGADLRCLAIGVSPRWMPERLTRASAPPVITHTPITTAVLARDLVVTARITDDGGVASATLHYRPSLSAPYAAVPLIASGENYTATIPAAAVPVPGPDYYIEARDADGNVTRAPFAAPFLPFHVDVPSTHLLVLTGGPGAGRVQSDPASDFACGGGFCVGDFPQRTTVTLTAVPAAGSRFLGWWATGCSGTGPCTIAANERFITVQANFGPLPTFELVATRTLTGTGRVTSNPAGIDCGADCRERYRIGTTVTLTAAVEPGSVFSGWSGGGCLGTGGCTVTMTADTFVVANFQALPRFTVRVQKSGRGRGRVASAPGGIDCGGDCSESYAQGAALTLTATPESGHTFLGWSGGGCGGTGRCVTTVRANAVVTARFEALTLRVPKAGDGRGVITSTPGGIDCGSDCSEIYPRGTRVTLTAMPEPGHTFVGWSGAGCAGTGTCRVTLTADTTVTARFTILTLRVQKVGTGGGVVTSAPAGIVCGGDCSEAYPRGTRLTLTAVPDPGSIFNGWSGGGCAGLAPCTLTVSAAVAVTGRFTRH